MKGIIWLLFMVLLCAGQLYCGSGGGSGENAPAIVADNEPDTDGRFLIPGLEDGATGVEPEAILRVEFTADMNQPTINQSTFRVIDASGQDVEGTLAYDPQTRQVTFTPKHSYTYDETYTLIITNGILDRDGRHLDQNQSFRFTIKADNDRPVIIARSPLAENGPAPSNSTISIRFNEPLAATSVTPETLRITAAGNSVTGDISFSENNTVLTFAHNGLPAGSRITVLIDGITDRKGNACDDKEWSFDVAQNPDTTAPLLFDKAPSGIKEDINSVITCTFSEAVNPASLSGSSFVVRHGSNPVAGTFNFSDDNKKVLFTPQNSLPYNTNITVELTSGITDLAGNPFAGTSWNFTTGPEPDVTAPLAVEVSPVNIAEDVPVNSSISIRFNENIAPDSINAESFTVSTDATPLAGTRACTGDTITFTPAENLPWNRVITVTITATVTDTAGNAFAGTSWSFTTCEEPDTTKLSVLSTTPADNETGTISQPLVNQNIIISFDDDLDPSSVSNATVVL